MKTTSKASKKPTGFILYRGPSLLNGAPIVVVAITASKNVKTGNMVQTYILADNGKSPVVNAQELHDVAVCGECPHRRGMGGACYVNLGQGPRAVADGVVRGIYPYSPEQAAKLSAGRMVRLGTYGDPAAAPAHVWSDLVAHAAGHTGYTHQWKTGKAHAVMGLVMASADNEQDRIEAKAKGYRTFRIRPAAAPMLPGEFVCPASSEAGYRKTCATCGACNGGIETRKADAVIVVHGTLAGRFAVAQ